MWKLPLVLFGLVELAMPRRIIEFSESIAFSNPEEARLRSWTVPIARVEGIGFVALAASDGPVSTRLEPLLLPLGVAALLAPRRFVEAALHASYVNARRIELKPWVLPFTRLLGLLYVLAGVRARVRRQNSSLKNSVG